MRRAVWVAALLIVPMSGCAGEGDGPEPHADFTPSQRTSATPSPSSSLTPTPEAPEAPEAPEEPEAPEVDNELGMAHEDIEALGRAADAYGYGLGPGTALSYEQATNFAYAVAVTCDELRSGETTLEESVQVDVADGAPPADARGFNAYLDSTFCPQYYAAGN